MSKSRLPIPRQRPGTITVRLAANRECPIPDFWASWGKGTDTPTATLCLSTITTLGHELTKRGYDPRTLRFSVQKAVAP